MLVAEGPIVISNQFHWVWGIVVGVFVFVLVGALGDWTWSARCLARKANKRPERACQQVRQVATAAAAATIWTLFISISESR